MTKLAFALHLMRVGPELRIAATECRRIDANGQTIWVSEMAEATAELPNKEAFPWTKPARALLLLLLRDLPLAPTKRMGLVGPEGSYAASLYDLVIRGKAKGGGKNWLQKMFWDPKHEIEHPLPTTLFRHQKHGERFFVGLGADWDHANVKVCLDSEKPLAPAEYGPLADLVERWDASPEAEPPPLTATLDLLVRDPATGLFTKVSEKPSLLPVKHRDELQLHVQLNQPSYSCLAWVDRRGEPFPAYPWDWTKIREKANWQLPVKFEERIEVRVPELGEAPGHILSVKDEVGLETIVLMVTREDRPSDDVVKRLPEMLRVRHMSALLPNLTGVVRSEFTRRRNSEPAALRLRGPVAIQRADPIRALHQKLGSSLVEEFDQVVILSFSNGGTTKNQIKKTNG
jgi:hypothetical protein